MDTLVFAYYCSGHGYGHATRVSAFTRHLLSLPLTRRLTVHIVSSAPRHVFADSIACGALYRFAEIDPVIVQPLAYRVDRQKSLQVLEDFLVKKDAMLDRECAWLREAGANCVLSDAAFLGCLAAKSAGIPSILITNFTFDSVYSYLATSLVDAPTPIPITPSGSTLSPSSSTGNSISPSPSEQLLPDVPIPESTLRPLVAQLHEGYQHADLLLRLPGYIPIPSFPTLPALPSSQWVDPILNRFHDYIRTSLLSPLNTQQLLPPKPFPNSSITIPRSVRDAPLLVRPPSPGIYTPEGRAAFLQKNSFPDFTGMKILVVSFGGQVFKRPGNSRTGSRLSSRFSSQEALALHSSRGLAIDYDSVGSEHAHFSSKRSSREYKNSHKTSTSVDRLVLMPRDPNSIIPLGQTVPLDLEAVNKGLRTHIKSKPTETASQLTRRNTGCSDENALDYSSRDSHKETQGQGITLFNGVEATAKRRHTLPRSNHNMHQHRRLATASHIMIPGAPPASKHLRTPSLITHSKPGDDVNLPDMCIIPPSPRPDVATNSFPPTAHISDPSPLSEAQNSGQDLATEDTQIGLLPDENWIAVICGVSKEQWNAENEEGGLPEGFYVAPRDVYMPDLIAIGDVVLGKLGYGMTSECVDACTPFVYVSRPLFVEEHGLRMYLDQEGVGIELSRAGYENGEWAQSVQEACLRGQEMKRRKKEKELEFYTRTQPPIQESLRGGDNNNGRLSERERQGREMARNVIDWVDSVWDILDGKKTGNKITIETAEAERHGLDGPLSPIGVGVRGIKVS